MLREIVVISFQIIAHLIFSSIRYTRETIFGRQKDKLKQREPQSSDRLETVQNKNESLREGEKREKEDEDKPNVDFSQEKQRERSEKRQLAETK